jgi:hypothetical protein
MAEFNLIDGMQSQMNRCRSLIKNYKAIPTGAFEATAIKKIIIDAEKAIAGRDVAEMVKCYRKLEACE